MAKRLDEVVRFQSERLFDGAVNVDWYWNDLPRASKAAAAYIFHGPTYHGVVQDDIDDSREHRLQDTATFTKDIVYSCAGLSQKSFTLAIAGYGTGKSHLALTLAQLLSFPKSDNACSILAGLQNADQEISSEVDKLLREMDRPCLVIVLNGMRDFDLSSEISRQIIIQLHRFQLDTNPIDQLHPRFSQAVNLIKIAKQELAQELVEQTGNSEAFLIEQLNLHDEDTYAKVHQFFEQKGMPIKVLGSESLDNLINVTCDNYCGSEKPFARLLIIFDEFGRYTEFATVKKQIAGSGVLQQLYEGVQNNPSKAYFLGFIQFELNSYVQRIAQISQDLKNDILRVIPRYQTAEKIHLSTNLETIIAHLIEKKSDIFDDWFGSEKIRRESEKTSINIQKWYPLSQHYHIWKDSSLFHTVIAKGCWPLSPYATWLLYYLTSAGKYLQERSALYLLANVLKKNHDRPMEIGRRLQLLSATDLWSNELLQEFISSEESGRQGMIAHAYSTVFSRHGNQFNPKQLDILKAIVLAEKLKLKAKNRSDAIEALSTLCGFPAVDSTSILDTLQKEYNIIEWDNALNQFDILGDTVPRAQFLNFIRQRISDYDEQAKADLFINRIANWCPDIIKDLPCDFAESNAITTKEWFFRCVTSNLNKVKSHLETAILQWKKSFSIDESRGTIIYCYVNPALNIEKIKDNIAKELTVLINGIGQKTLPILVVLIVDENGHIGQRMAELALLTDEISEQDKNRFGPLLETHKGKTVKLLNNDISEAIKKRHYVAIVEQPLINKRLNKIATEIFASVYKQPLSFPFDGFTTARGNAAKTCRDLTVALLNGQLDYDVCMAKPVKDRNRSLAVLNDNWQCFNQEGKITVPQEPVARSIIQNWRKKLDEANYQFEINEELKKIFLPPYGANLASAGLLLGVFIAPLVNIVNIVDDQGMRYNVNEWMKKVQDDIFPSQLLNFNKISPVYLEKTGEVSKEWEALLNAWEHAETYREKCEYFVKAEEFKKNTPVPPAYEYKYIHLSELAKRALNKIEKNEARKSEAQEKCIMGYEKRDISLLSWGGAILVRLRDKMLQQGSVWPESELQQFEYNIEKIRHTITQLFPDYLESLRLATDDPDKVGSFKHKYAVNTYNNLNLLQLEDEADRLAEHVQHQIQIAGSQAEALKLAREIKSWISKNEENYQLFRAAKIKTLLVDVRDFSNKLNDFSNKVNLTDLTEVQKMLAQFSIRLNRIKKELDKKITALWESEINSSSDIAIILKEIQKAESVFVGCESDLEDLEDMRRLLQSFRDAYNELANENLSWDEFDHLAKRLESNIIQHFTESDPLPWNIKETFLVLVMEIAKKRENSGKKWLQELDLVSKKINDLNVKEADILLKKASFPPPVATREQRDKAATFAKHAEQRCQVLEVEWLVQRFLSLPNHAKRNFLDKIQVFQS